MNFALLGFDSSTWPLAQAAIARGHALTWGGELGAGASEFRQLAPNAVVSDQWESLLLGTAADAVIVGRAGDEDARAEVLAKLVQAAVPVLTVHPVHSSMLIYYELDMIRRETHGVIVPSLPGREHPAVVRLRQLLVDGLGSIEQIVCERSLVDRSRQNVSDHFARDIDLARSFCGELTKLSALAPPGGERYANLGVQLSGPNDSLVRWSVGPVDKSPGGRFTVVAGNGKASLWMPERGPWRLDWQLGDKLASEDFSEWNAAAASIDELARVVAGEPPRMHWIDASRSVELTETIDRSLNKGRTIELHYDDYTEEGTFKGTMTSLGCGLLFGGLLLLPLAAVAAKMDVPLARYWAWGLVVVFVAFLALQLLRLAMSKAAPTGGVNSTDRSS